MHRSLPPRPSLAQLKHQAKDLRTDAREGDRDAIGILRRLRRFESATDPQIASANVALSDAQYALAMEYGFASWPALKRHVESLAGNARGAVRRDDGSVIVDGFQRARWGGGTRRQNSNIAVLALISEALGDDVDYDFLMGATGAAFPVEFSRERLNDSDVDAIRVNVRRQLLGTLCSRLSVR